jgi:hypothetical protein
MERVSMIVINWSQFKELLDKGHVRARYVTSDIGYMIHGADQGLIYTCNVATGEADFTEFEDSYKDAIDSLKVASVSTQFERDDIVLKLCKGESAFDGSGDAEISLKVPGTPGSGDGRYVAGGYAFTDIFGFGDYVSQVNIVDVDDILGMGAHTVLQTYHDTEIDAANAGWYFWPNAQVGGEVELDPIGYYGFIPSGLYIEVYFKRKAGNTATKVYCDIWWGKSYA